MAKQPQAPNTAFRGKLYWKLVLNDCTWQNGRSKPVKRLFPLLFGYSIWQYVMIETDDNEDVAYRQDVIDIITTHGIQTKKVLIEPDFEDDPDFKYWTTVCYSGIDGTEIGTVDETYDLIRSGFYDIECNGRIAKVIHDNRVFFVGISHRAISAFSIGTEIEEDSVLDAEKLLKFKEETIAYLKEANEPFDEAAFPTGFVIGTKANTMKEARVMAKEFVKSMS